ncbi:hypothetical protein halTADL_0041 [Halohasta litchfieldiae]|jgi:hypothetical protein|uniref:DUF8124 domain-containing protein n=1 Tax=Halohasta litchfieldiae TaxID=1073996 RepID=A0A1H6Y4C7_9EURY|nr:hypothetical protein [Halohasta litchfieldiae]ATW86864.1 hypothetical protein halTADL_0041 [Halohasta litchfieldiae]SEJ31980.1 hypothetical protein SAMN05444271_14619 [Halohasta litchfieldiae]
MTTDKIEGDRFLVGIHLTESDLEFVVRVPSDIDSGWTDPEEFQRLVADVTWEELDQESTLRTIATAGSPGDTVMLGSVRLMTDGTVVSHDLSSPDLDDE